MGRNLLTVLFVLSASGAFAQNYNTRPVYNGAVQARPYVDTQAEELEVIENERSETLSEAQGSDTAQIDNFKGSNKASNTQGSPQINIYNANSNANKQKAATTSAADGYANSASQVDSSNVDQYGNGLADARKNLEYQTNEAAINQIELSRIEDEKYRAQKVFSTSYSRGAEDNKYDNKYEDKENYEDTSKQYVKPLPVYEKPVAGDSSYVSDVGYSYFQKENFFAAPVLSILNPPSNANGNLGVGVQFGTLFSSGFSIDGTFVYSNLEMDPYHRENIDGVSMPGYLDVDQYSFIMGIKYNFAGGYGITPHIGALLGYTYRDFMGTVYNRNSATSSTAVDAGVSVGADVKISNNFSVGVAYQFMSNLSYERDIDTNSYLRSSDYRNDYRRSNRGTTASEALEEQGTQMLMFTGKFSF